MWKRGQLELRVYPISRGLKIQHEMTSRCSVAQETGLLMAEAPRRIEQSGLPTALMWHPLLGSDFEDRLVNTILVLAFKTMGYCTPPQPPLARHFERNWSHSTS